MLCPWKVQIARVAAIGIGITASGIIERACRPFLIANAGMVSSSSHFTCLTWILPSVGRLCPPHRLLRHIRQYRQQAHQPRFLHLYPCLNEFYAIAYTPLLASYTFEILPFFLHAKGLAWVNLGVPAVIIFNQYTNPIALDGFQWKCESNRY